MTHTEMEFWERAATAALTGLCANAAGVDTASVTGLAAQLADALLEEKRRRG